MTLYRTPDGRAFLAFTLCAECHRALGQLPGLRYPREGQRLIDAQWDHISAAAHLPRVTWDEPAPLSAHTPDRAERLAQLAEVIDVALRQTFKLVGVDPDSLPQRVDIVAGDTAHHLEAMAQAWTEGYYDGREDGRYDERYAEGINPNAVPKNPYRKLLDDRRAFVRELVENEYGALPGDDGAIDNVLGDDNAEWFDAVLDAHDQWHTLQSRGRCRAALHRVGAGDPPGGVPCNLVIGHTGKHITASGRAWGDVTDQQQRNIAELFAKVRADAAAGNRYTVVIDGVQLAPVDDQGHTNADRDVESLTIRAEQAEARVAELDRALRDVKDALDYDTGYNAVKINGARIALARAGYGTHPDSDAWQPPYSAGQALNRIWDVISTQRVSPVYKLNRVLEILDEMGYHEHVHVALPSWSAPEVCGDTYGQKVCSRKPGHYGEHIDGRHPDIKWASTILASEAADEGLTP